MYYDTFSRNVNEVIDLATGLAKRYGCRYIGSEHILFGLMNATDGRAAAILRQAEVSNERFLYYFQKSIDRNTIIPGNMFTPRTKNLFEKAVDISLKCRSGYVGTEHLLLALLLSIDSLAVTILKALRVDVEKMAEEIATSLMQGIEIDQDQGDNQDESILYSPKSK